MWLFVLLSPSLNLYYPHLSGGDQTRVSMASHIKTLPRISISMSSNPRPPSFLSSEKLKTGLLLHIVVVVRPGIEMGASPHAFIVPGLEGSKATHDHGSHGGCKFLPAGSSSSTRRRSWPSSTSKRRSSSRVVRIKRCMRRSGSRIERKVRTLKNLIPKVDRSTGLEGLFRDTADYILSLETRVRVMRMMVDKLAGSNW